ncbi:ArsR family transcriptional regulator [Flavobacteriaceae bacterium]|nr:ArsR family transcriptional regulator [Flavobacteriaceae bacterium]
MLDSLITSKTRLRMLVKFFINTANKGYLNGLANEFNESTNSIRKELNNLSAAGYLIKVKSDNKVIYNANKKHPLFTVLQKVIRQHLGIEQIVDSILNNLGDVKSVALVGDYAKGIDSGLIKVVLIGNEINVNYLADLIVKVEKKITRKVSFKIVDVLSKESLVIYNNEKI